MRIALVFLCSSLTHFTGFLVQGMMLGLRVCRKPLSSVRFSQSDSTYEFLDCGDYKRLELFNNVLVSRC